jgi:hypothetical protein
VLSTNYESELRAFFDAVPSQENRTKVLTFDLICGNIAKKAGQGLFTKEVSTNL